MSLQDGLHKRVCVLPTPRSADRGTDRHVTGGAPEVANICTGPAIAYRPLPLEEWTMVASEIGDVASRRRQRVSLAVAAALAAVLLLSSCAAGPNPAVGTSDDGFWQGLWHGMILPVTFVISLFSDDVSIYEVANNGNLYDFGFVFGVAISLGGSGGGATRASKRG